MAAAMYRAAHQVLEQGGIFTDPLAAKIIGKDNAAIAAWAEKRPARRKMRIFIAVRTRFAEDALEQAVAEGVGQLVVLGAGLDTFAYRNPFPRLRVFEVDHPDTQEWKRQRLAQADIALPDSLRFAPVNFERESLADGLAAAGFDATQPAFFTWLGVVPYLTAEAIWSTLAFVASLPGNHVVFDYGNPPESLPAELRAAHEKRAARVAELGEAFLSYFDTGDLHAKLGHLGFTEIDDAGPRQIAGRYLGNGVAVRHDTGGHVVHAKRGRQAT